MDTFDRAPHFREAGVGRGVVCLHSSASSSGQWRTLMDRLSDGFRVIAVDLYGYGKSPAWPEERQMYMDDELSLLEPVFRSAGDAFHLVGHSYGGAVALKGALKDPRRLKSLVLYEPVLFSVLAAANPNSPATREIQAVRDDTIRAVTLGNPEYAAERFVDYWLGPGSFSGMPEARRSAVANSIRKKGKAEWHAVFHEPTPLPAFAAVDVPALFLTGSESPASTRHVARLLCGVLPRVTVIEFEGLGHMGPVTHPERVNEAIESFLQEVP